jgi:hypothetical protein
MFLLALVSAVVCVANDHIGVEYSKVYDEILQNTVSFIDFNN